MKSEDLEKIHGIFIKLYQSERALAELYSLCAKTWPEETEFWQEIEEDERKHAGNLVRIAEILAENPENFTIGRPFKSVAVDSFTEYIRETIDKIKSEDVYHNQMLSRVIEIEQSIIELRYMEIVKSDDPEFMKLIGQVVSETRQHLNKIKQKKEEKNVKE